MRRQTRLAAAALMSCALASVAHAQENPERVRQREALEQAAQARATHAAIQAAEQAELLASLGPPPQRFDLEFPGGPLAEYIAALREKNPSANLMLTGSVDLAVVPAVSLKNITTKAAIGVLPDSMQEAATENYMIHSRIVDNAGGEPVFMVEVRSQGRRSSVAPQATVVSLAELLRARGATALKIEDVLSAIEAATSMVGAEAPKMRYHAETRLLLFSGSKSQIDVMHATLDALGRTADALE